MDSDVSPIKELFDDLFTLLEALETQNLAVLQFLKDQGVAPDEKLAPYLERASTASSVKWRAARARMNHLLAPPPRKSSEPTAQKGPQDTKTESKRGETEEDQPEKSKAKPETKAEPQSKTESTEAKSGDSKPGETAQEDATPKDAAAPSPHGSERKEAKPKTEQSADRNTKERGDSESKENAQSTSEGSEERQKGSAASR